jgi:hypothetical protein
MVKVDEAGLLAVDLVGEALGGDERIQGTVEDEVEHAEAVETIFVETFKQGTAALAQTVDFPTIS